MKAPTLKEQVENLTKNLNAVLAEKIRIAEAAATVERLLSDRLCLESQNLTPREIAARKLLREVTGGWPKEKPQVWPVFPRDNVPAVLVGDRVTVRVGGDSAWELMTVTETWPTGFHTEGCFGTEFYPYCHYKRDWKRA